MSASIQLSGDYQDFLEWKKQFEPTVDVWQGLNYFKKTGDDLKWFTKVEINKSDQFCVYFSNLVELWSEELTFEDFETKLQALNPNLEGGDAKIFTKFVKDLLLGRQTSTVTASFEDNSNEDSMQIQYKTKYSGVPFRWEFNGCKCTTSEAKKEIVDPFLMLLMQYQRRELDLFDLLVKKDREIEAYKTTGAKLTRSREIFEIQNVETVKFNAENWLASDESSEAFLDTCRDFRADRCHPLQDLRVRTMFTAAETVGYYLDACKGNAVESDKNEPVREPIPAADDVPKLVPMKRAAAEIADDEKDEEPDTTTAAHPSTQTSRRGRKKKILRL